MPLRKSPVRTAALLAASRTNGCKSHGPKTLRGKARASLNALKTGRYVVQLRRKLVDAGDREGEALYARIEARVAEAFCSGRRPESASPDEEHQLRRLTSLVWCFYARRLPRPPSPKTNLECALDSRGEDTGILPRTRIQFHDPYRRIGLAFWIQRRRVPSWKGFWRRHGREFERIAMGLEGAWRPAPEAAWEWEQALRSRIFRLRRPNIWQRLQYGLYRDGTYSPELEVRGRRELKRMCLAGIPVSSWPPLLGSLPRKDEGESSGIDWALIPFGFEKLA